MDLVWQTLRPRGRGRPCYAEVFSCSESPSLACLRVSPSGREVLPTHPARWRHSSDGPTSGSSETMSEGLVLAMTGHVTVP